jgi:hypothetical protein
MIFLLLKILPRLEHQVALERVLILFAEGEHSGHRTVEILRNLLRLLEYSFRIFDSKVYFSLA